MLKLPNKLMRYVLFIFLIATCLLIYLFVNYNIPSLELLIFFSLLAIVTETLLIPLINGVAVSVGFAISLATIIIGGPLTAALVSGIGFLFRFPRIQGKGRIHFLNTPIYKTAFNVGQSVIVSGFSGIAYIISGGNVSENSFVFSITSLIIVITVYILLNSSIVVKYVSITTQKRFLTTWLQNIRDVVSSAIAVSTLGIIIALAYISYGPWAVLLFFGPLLLARYSFKLYIDMRHMYMETIEAFTKAIEAKDSYTSGHASRVGKYAEKLAKAVKLSDYKIDKIKTAALLHDIGKIGIEDGILKKPGKLSKEEYEIIKQHPVIGAQILKDVYFLKDVINIIKYHHERYDGSGYPEGISGDDIPIEAAVLAIADVFDAMTSDRPYRKALTREQALNEIESNAGTQFHPELAEAFVGLMRKEDEEELLENVS